MKNTTEMILKPRTFAFTAGGSGRAARHLAPAVASLNRRLEGGVSPLYIDPAVDKARDVARSLQAEGVSADYLEARIEHVPLDGVGPVVLHVDRPEPILAVLERAPPAVDFLVYLLVAAAGLPLLGLMAAIGRHDIQGRQQLTHLMRWLAVVTARAGSGRVVGTDANPAHRAQEPGVRREFTAHFERNLPRFAGDAELEDVPVQLTRGGAAPEPVITLSPGNSWRSPEALVSGLIDAAPSPLMRGANLVLVEPNTAGAMRLHTVRLRASDGALSLHGAVLPGQPGLMAKLPGASERAATAMERSMTLTAEWSRFNAVATSD